MNSAFSMHLPKEDVPLQSDLFNIDFNTLLNENVASSNITANEFPMCPECQSQGRDSRLGLYQINFGEAISMCPHPLCAYPMKEENLVESFVVKQDASVLETTPKQNLQKLKKSRKKQLDSCEEFFNDFDVNSLLVDSSVPYGGKFENQEAIINHENADSAEKMVEPEPPNERIDSDNKEQTVIDTKNNEQSDKTLTAETAQEKIAVVRKSNENIHENLENSIEIETDYKSVDFLLSDKGDEAPFEMDKNRDKTKEMSDTEVDPRIITKKNIATKSPISPAEDTPQNTMPDKDGFGDSACETQVQMPSNEPESTGDIDDPVLIEDSFCDEDNQKTVESLPLPPVHKEIIQWSNESNSCWLDSILMCLVNSVNVRAILNSKKDNPQCLLRKVCLEYDSCQEFHRNHINNRSKNLISKITNRLSNVRISILQSLSKKLNIRRGGFQSLLEMFPMVLKTCPEVEKYFKIHTLWHFQCDSCGHERARRSIMHVLSFPHTSHDFHPLNASFERPCFNCNKNTGVMEITMEKLPPCLIFHFQNGLPHSNFKVFDFGLQGTLYSVIAVVQYVIDPVKHFIAWIRDPKTNRWLCCNDLEGPVCRWQQKQPRIPPGQVHMVLWERQSVQDPQNADESRFATMLNNEANSVADELPLELFYAHEKDETIVLSEDKVMHDTNTMKTVDNSMQKEDIHSPVLHIKNGSANNNKQQNHDAILAQTNVANGKKHHSSATVLSQNSFVSPNTLANNNSISVIPASNGSQTIQVVAPSNTCNIVIVMSDNKNQEILYNSQQITAQSPPATQSFLRDKRFHSNKRHLNSFSSEFSSSKPKRHFRLSGYAENKSIMKKFKFSPLRVTTKKNPVREETKPAQPKPVTEKSDSEKCSEVSELSDLLPDFDVRSHSSGDSHNSAPAAFKRSIVTPTPSLQNSGSASPAASLNGLDGSYMPTGTNSNAIFSQDPTQDSVGRENDQASAELFFLNTFFP